MPTGPGFANPILRATDTSEMQGGAGSLEDSYSTYLTTGLEDSLTSGAIGIANTGIALANSLGANITPYSESQEIRQTFGDDAAGFYDRHRSGVDFTGMALTSLVPGTLALKGLKAAQITGRVTESIAAATGLESAPIGLGTDAVANATKSVLAGNTFTLNNPAVYKAIAQGAVGQVVDGVVVTAATLAVDNQDSALNPEHLGYFQALGSEFVDSLPMLGFFSVLGAGVDTLGIRGAIKAAWNERQAVKVNDFGTTINDLESPIQANLQYQNPGDVLRYALQRRNEFNTSPEFGISPADQTAVRSKGIGNQMLTNTIQQSFAKINQAGETGEAFLNSLLDPATPLSQAEIDSITSGLMQTKGISVADAKENYAFFARTRAPYQLIEANSPEEFGNALAANIRNNPNALYSESQIQDMVSNAVSTVKASTPGMNFGALPEMMKKNIADKIFGQIPQYRSFKVEPGVVWPVGTIYTNPQRLGEVYPKWAAQNAVNGVAPSEAEFKNYVLLHELGHSKSNGSQMLELMTEAIRNKSPVMNELMNLSRQARPGAWESFDQQMAAQMRNTGLSKEEIMSNLYTQPQNQLPYITRIAELTADAASQLTHPNLAIAEKAAKQAPMTATMLKKYGALRQPWEPNTGYYNIASKQMSTGILPGANDLGQVAVNKYGQISVRGTELTYAPKDNFFSADNLVTGGNKKVDYMEASARWAAAANSEPRQLNGVYIAQKDDLPALEKLATSNLAPDAKIAIYDKDPTAAVPTTPGMLNYTLSKQKQTLRDVMQGTGKYNEQELYHILNISQDRALGQNKGELLMMGARDYSKPENLKLTYTSQNPADVDISTRSFAASSFRQDINNTVQQQTAAQLLEEQYSKYPEIPMSKWGTLSQTDTRAGFLTPLRTGFGTLRESASLVGTTLHNQIQTTMKGIDNLFMRHYSWFGQEANVADRMEFAMMDNALRRQLFVFVKNPETGERYAVQRTLARSIQSQEDAGVQDLIEAAEQEVAAKSGNAYKMSDAVGSFYEDHLDGCTQIWDKQKVAAIAQGKTLIKENDVLYPPAPDLKRTPYFAFVSPKEIIAESEPQKYMLYGQTEQELQAKIKYVNDNYGHTHNVFTKDQVTQYKQMLGDYDAGQVYDALHFDSSIGREGSAQTLTPNLDIYSPVTLDRYLSFHQTQQADLLRTGIQMKYGQLFSALKASDDFFGSFGRSTIGAESGNVKSSIYKNTMNMMLDLRDDASGGIDGLYKRANDFLGTKGSALVDNVVKSVMAPFSKTGNITQDAFGQMNSQLEKLGYRPPFQNVMDAIASSPETKNSATLPLLVRTMNNITSTFMLSLDACNTIIQTISSPILLSPLIKEMRMSLDIGSPEMKALDNITGTFNPATGIREPSSAMLMTNAAKNYWSPEGKAFLAEMQNRGIVGNFLRQYNDVLDFSTLNGNHSLRQLNNKVEQLAQWGATKFSGQQFAENFTRFLAADVARQLTDIRGITGDEQWSIIAGMVDKMHGIYRATQRPGAFNGVIGQAVGLYQTYLFNFMQNAMKFVESGNTKLAIQMGALQASMYGVRSLPGFQTLNKMVADTNRNQQDLYNVTGADDPKSAGAYLMYGAASHMFGVPMDLFSRGDQTIRNSLVIPTNLSEIPGVSAIGKAVGNLAQTAQMIVQPGVPAGQALLFGLAHNSLNRPLQGLATIAMDRVTSSHGDSYFNNANYEAYDKAQSLSLGGMFARVLGTKPLDESILMDQYFQRKQYQAAARKDIEDMSVGLKLSLANGGSVTPQQIDDFSLQYERSGGTPEGFNSFWTRQLNSAGKPEVEQFQQQMIQKTATQRAYQRMMLDRNPVQPWDYPSGDTASTATSGS